MKKIIHLSYLTLLLFIYNQTHSAEREELTPIQDAHNKLRQLLIKQETGESLNSSTYSEILGTLNSYGDQATIWMFDTNGNPTGKYDTKGWKEDETIKEEVALVRNKLGLLTKADKD